MGGRPGDSHGNRQQARRRNAHPRRFLRAGYAVRLLWTAPAGRLGAPPAVLLLSHERRDFRALPGGQITIPAAVLDAAVWKRIEALLTRPDIIAGELTGLRANDPTEANIAAVNRALLEVTKRQSNLSRALAVLSEDGAAPVLLELEAGAAEKRRLQGWPSARPS